MAYDVADNGEEPAAAREQILFQLHGRKAYREREHFLMEKVKERKENF